MVIVINSVIGGFGRKDWVWFAASTVQLYVLDYSQLSDHNFTERLEKNKADHAQLHLFNLWKLY